MIGSLLILLQELLFVLSEFLLSLLSCLVRSLTVCRSSPKCLSNKVVLITGAGGGIGRELVRQLHGLKAILVLWDVRKELCEELVKELERKEERSSRCLVFKCDVSNEDEVQKVAEETREALGNVDIDVLINNAGLMPSNSFLKLEKREIRAVFNVNCLAHFWTSQHFLPQLMNKQGNLVCVASVAGALATPYLSAYCASKFAVRGLMDALRAEHHLFSSNSSMHFTTILPFAVDTGMATEPRSRFEALIPVLKPRDVANRIVEAIIHDEEGEIFIPRLLHLTLDLLRMMPDRARFAIQDFLGCTVQPHREQ